MQTKTHKWDFLKEVCWWLLPSASPKSLHLYPRQAQVQNQVWRTSSQQEAMFFIAKHDGSSHHSPPRLVCEVLWRSFLERKEWGWSFTYSWVAADRPLCFVICMLMQLQQSCQKFIQKTHSSCTTGIKGPLYLQSPSAQLLMHWDPQKSILQVPQRWGSLAQEQDKAPLLCSCRQFLIKELMWQ